MLEVIEALSEMLSGRVVVSGYSPNRRKTGRIHKVLQSKVCESNLPSIQRKGREIRLMP